MNIIILPNQNRPRFCYPPGQIAFYLAEKLQIPLVCDKNWEDYEACDRASSHGAQYDTIYLVSGAFGFCSFRQFIIGAVQRCKRLVYVQNDFTCPPPSQIKRLLPSVPVKERWCNIPRFDKDDGSGFPQETTYVNWNQLTWDPQPLVKPTVPGLMYYGAMREGRRKYFDKYFETDLYPVTVSCSARAMKKWHEEYPTVDTEPLFDSFYDLQEYTATLYIEDELTHTQFNSPANRFYEAVSAGVPMLFDKKSVGTFEKAGISVYDNGWIVDGPDDVRDALDRSHEIQVAQRAAWGGSNFKAKLDEEIDKVIKR
jgi:hypothetical protein